jgi:hypothetical protein
VGIEIGSLAGEQVALEAEINALFPETGHDPAVRVLAGALSAPLAVRGSDVSEHPLKGLVIVKLGEKGRKTAGIGVEIPQEGPQISNFADGAMGSGTDR